MSKEEQERREVLALVSWLQTFDQFPFSVVDGLDGDNVTERFNIALESLENIKISRAVVHVAEEVCGIKRIDMGSSPSTDEIWRTMLHIATTKSRFEIYTTPHNVSSNAEIPHVVLSNLLDFAVTSPDLDERRKYIQRIMSLSKSVQKILMNLIERMKKTLPRRPKNSSSSLLPKNVRSPRALCGRNELVEGPDAPIPKSNKAIIKKYKEPLLDDDSSDNGSVATPPQETPQRLRGFGSPKRERNVHGIPQSEPRAASTGRERSRERSASRERAAMLVTQSEKKPSSRPSSRMRQHDSEEATRPRQPEGHYMSASDKKRSSCHKGFASPPRDRQPLRKPKGFASPGKQRHSTGSVITNADGQAPFRERQVQTQRAAFVSINNQSAKHGGMNNMPPKAPPPPPPPYPPAEQRMPATSTPSDELEIDNHMSIPLTDTTTSTATDSSAGTSTELAVLKLNSSVDKPRPTGKMISVDRKRQGEGFSTPTRSLLDSPSQVQTPEVSLAMYERDVDSRMMFSPDDSVLQSPMQVDDFVKELRAKNKSLESILQSYQKRERELSQKMESTESKLRKEMMKLESRALGREDELRHNYENEMTKLKKDLRAEKERNKESKRAREELANANDELDLMQHTHEKLLEATEKIRKYKERLDSMSDFKEALKREQTAHSKSVDECVRLQNELNVLQPLKRQLEDYKAKAVETEVQLAECTDALARLERERDALDGARNDVIRGAQAQKAQAEELRNFIRLEEKQGGPGIGEGISELNPELQEELIKLRNENEKLRSFANQRTDDSVQKLHENLEDSTARQERFKMEFLKSKNQLADTESLLAEAKQKLAELESEIEQKDKKAEEYEERLQKLEDQCAACLEDIARRQEQLEDVELEKKNLQTELAEWKEMADKLETELKKRSGDLDDTKAQLDETEELRANLEAAVTEWKIMADKLEAELLRRSTELETTKESLTTSQAETAQVEEDLAEWKQMANKFETELLKKNEELDATRKSLESMEEEKETLSRDLQDWKLVADKLEQELKSRSTDLEETNRRLCETEEALRDADEEKACLSNNLNEWKEMAGKLEEELNSRTTDLEETKKQLCETEEALDDAGQRQADLLNQLDASEKKILEKDEEFEKVTKTLKDTTMALQAAEAAVEEAGRREASLNEDCDEVKEVSEKLLNQLKEEKKARKALIEENHRTLEATREVLNSKAKKDIEELQENMNRLLNDERKAYRGKNEKAQHDFKKLEEQYKRKVQETLDDGAANLKAQKEDLQRRMKEQESEAKQELENFKQQEETKRKGTIEQFEAHMQQLKANFQVEMINMANDKTQVIESLEKSEAHGQHLTTKNTNLKKKLEFATHQLNDYEQEQDDLRTSMKKLEREKAKVEEENERYRRQLGGRYGADGQMQNQLDKLNKELMEAHNENRDLKRKLATKTSSQDMSMSYDLDGNSSGYSRGAVNTHAIAQIRSGYEEQLANLNDEKRELVMKNSAAITDVQKAEQIAWDREQEITRLKGEMTSLQLQCQRAQLATADENLNSSFYSNARDLSFNHRDLSFLADPQSTEHARQHPEALDIGSSVLPSSSEETEERVTPIKRHTSENGSSRSRGRSRSSSPRHSVASKTSSYERQMRDLHSAEKPNSYDLNLRSVHKHKTGSSKSPKSHVASLMDPTQTSAATETDEPGECQQS